MSEPGEIGEESVFQPSTFGYDKLQREAYFGGSTNRSTLVKLNLEPPKWEEVQSKVLQGLLVDTKFDYQILKNLRPTIMPSWNPWPTRDQSFERRQFPNLEIKATHPWLPSLKNLDGSLDTTFPKARTYGKALENSGSTLYALVTIYADTPLARGRLFELATQSMLNLFLDEDLSILADSVEKVYLRGIPCPAFVLGTKELFPNLAVDLVGVNLGAYAPIENYPEVIAGTWKEKVDEILEKLDQKQALTKADMQTIEMVSGLFAIDKLLEQIENKLQSTALAKETPTTSQKAPDSKPKQERETEPRWVQLARKHNALAAQLRQTRFWERKKKINLSYQIYVLREQISMAKRKIKNEKSNKKK